jgi:AcrR family transcriptional regulator
MSRLGRPREFDREAALAQAMRLFWTHGYEGVSLSDLTAAMGIGRPSLYAAFGSKEALFREAVELYDAQEGARVAAALEESATAREAVEEMLRVNARAYTDCAKPRGCLIVMGALVGAPENGAVRDWLAAHRRAGEAALEARLRRGVAEGDLPKDTDTALLAAFYTSLLQGLSIQARDGAGPGRLEAIIRMGMAHWPAPAA